MFILSMGSCRTDGPSERMGVPNCGLSGRYATGDHVQGLEILRRKRIVPPELQRHVFFGTPVPDRYKLLLDLSSIQVDRVILEVCRKHSFVKDGWILMNHKKGATHKQPELEEVQVIDETPEVMKRNLDILQDQLPGCPMLITSPPTCFGVTTWYEIAATVSDWCHTRGHTYFDPSILAIRYGRSQCFENNGEDIFHFTDFMHHRIADVYRNWISHTDLNMNAWRTTL